MVLDITYNQKVHVALKVRKNFKPKWFSSCLMWKILKFKIFQIMVKLWLLVITVESNSFVLKTLVEVLLSVFIYYFKKFINLYLNLLI